MANKYEALYYKLADSDQPPRLFGLFPVGVKVSSHHGKVLSVMDMETVKNWFDSRGFVTTVSTVELR